ncbi:MAG TPA: hypothetical protein VFK94_02115 [Patescibacteria group bacterium]|nr:hypothetical protein [Patescibacteria group bacterium]
MSLRSTKIKQINFTGGINAWNREALLGTDTSNDFKQSHPLVKRELPEGFVDDILNMDFQADGSLITRGRFIPHSFAATHGPNDAVAESSFLCTKDGQDTGTRVAYLIATKNGNTYKFFRDNSTSPFFTHTWAAGTNLPCAVYYNSSWWVYSYGLNNYLKFTDSGSLQTDGSITPASPGSGFQQVLVWKDRVWGLASNSYSVNWSAATDPSLWATANGGGFFQLPNKSVIADMIIFNDQLYLIDLSNNIWIFSYYTDPGTDGFLRQVVSGFDIGGRPFTGTGWDHRLAVSDNKLFVTGSQNVFQIVNDTAYPIADSLFLNLNAHDYVKIFNMGDRLLVHAVYEGATKSIQNYVYHHNTKAWTRYELNPGTVAGDVNKQYIDRGCLITQQEGMILALDMGGSAVTGSTGNGFYPIYRLEIDQAYFGNSRADGYISIYDGSGDIDYRSILVKLKTGPIYLGFKHQFKKFREFILTGWFGYRNDGTAPNRTPMKATVEFVPIGVADKTLNTMEILNLDDEAEHNYRIQINQRARAVQLTFEQEDSTTWTTRQFTSTGSTHNVVAPFIITDLALSYKEVNSLRPYMDDRAASTDTSVV